MNLLGLIFQICDDYLNLRSTVYNQNKGLCEDLTEGKFSFPVIHSIRSQPHNKQLINILKQKTKDEEVKKYAIKYMKSTGSFAYTSARVAELRDQALAAVSKLEGDIQAMGQTSDAGDFIRPMLEKLVKDTLQEDTGTTIQGSTT